MGYVNVGSEGVDSGVHEGWEGEYEGVRGGVVGA